MRKSLLLALTTLSALVLLVQPPTALAQSNASEAAQKTAENQIRRLLEPLLDKYCHDECKLMSVGVSVDIASPEELAPGFDEVQSKSTTELVPASAKVKILMDDKVGPVSRSKLLDLIQQFLDTLDYPVRVDTQITHFPLPQGSEGKIAELRDQVAKKFNSTIDALLQQFCPQQCLQADFSLQTDVVNGEEAQYGAQGEFVQDGDTAIKIKDIGATILVDDSLSAEERNNILEMAKLKTNFFKNVSLSAKSMKFPKPDLNDGGEGGGRNGRGLASSSDKSNKSEKSNSESNSTNSTNNNTTNKNDESTNKSERFEHYEKVERVENGDAVQAELKKFKLFGIIFAASVIFLLLFLVMASMRPKGGSASTVTRVIQSLASDPVTTSAPELPRADSHRDRQAETTGTLSKRYEIERLLDELTAVYAQQPRVAKQVFSRVLTEEGVETTAEYIHLFGEAIVVDMLRDPSLQSDISELMEFYARNPIELTDDEKLDLLRKLHNRTVAGKLVVMGNRSSNLFDFLAEMDGMQIMELVRTESLTVKSIVLTQCDPQKRSAIYSQLDPEVRMKLLTELSRIDYLPRDYIFNVANALKRKRRENPKLNTEALPGSEVLVSLLERTGQNLQRTVVKSLELSNPDSARTVKSKLVSVDTLRFLRDGQLLEVVLSLKHDELLQFLKGAPQEVRKVIFAKSPKELVVELEEELEQVSVLSREAYQNVERKVLNRMKVMANEGLINLIETNERMFSESPNGAPIMGVVPSQGDATKVTQASTSIKKVGGW